MITSPLRDAPPESDGLTDYDREHVKLYLRLLDAAADGAVWQEVAAVLFGLDAAQEPERAKRVYEAHLARARWMSATGYRFLAREEQH
ncbi:DNA -binding domain-containing protein [Jiella pacifica]|uniref:DUF2285 domain-containing protein n=1 Tax=Jiella pacifica TaxID=2696469 RepID=A0A6N9T8D1_9HYPH|nr:DUF2285 domain-containing protein [Jiella pacifica]NDW07663.1 DUF2285 domain-containing protein [Jiella pacifica]